MPIPAKSGWSPRVVESPYHLFVFDPGGTIGWAHFVIDPKAFTNRTLKVLPFLVHWDCGEFTGTEHEQIKAACAKVRSANMYKHHRLDAVTEDFELTQLIGGKNLLSPVRINAVIEWELKQVGITLKYQRRNVRTSTTPQRLTAYGFTGRWKTSGSGKDAFAAMQHAIAYVRRVKRESDSKPWVTDVSKMEPTH